METKLLPSINNECLSCEQKSNKKWLVITVFCIANIANSITWLTYSPVASKAAQRYNVNLNVINWLSMIFMILYIPGAIFATWALERHGLRYALLTATIIQVVGTVMRIGAVDGIWIVFAFIGQFFCALAQPFFLNAPPKLSVLWFPDEQRSIATSIGAVANPLGVGIGFLIPSAVLGPDENMDRFFLLHIVEAAISVVAFLLVFIAIKSDPSQGKERDNYKANFTFKTYISQSKIVIRDWHFICLLISFSIGVGVSSAIGTLSNQILKPFQYTDQVIGIYGALFIFLGITGSALFALYCDKTKRYSGVLILCFLGAGASLVWWRFELVPAREIPLGITMALAGFFLTPTIPLEMDYGAICLPEIGESIISGILMSGGQVVSLALVLFAGPLIDRDNSNIHYLAYGSAGACFFAGLILILSESIRFAYKKRQSHERIDGN